MSPAMNAWFCNGFDLYFVLRRGVRSHPLQRLFWDGALGVGFAISGGFMVRMTSGDILLGGKGNDTLEGKAGDDLIAARADIGRHGIEEGLGFQRKAELAQARRQHAGATVYGARDPGQPLRPVIDRIHRGDHRQQHLGGADVGGRLFAADVLLAGL